MWRLFVEETVKNQGMDFVAAKGNHDMDGWDDISGLWSDPQKGYAAQLTNLKPGECYGAYGEDMTCDYGGVTIVVSDVGVDQAGESANKQKYDYIDNALRNSKNKWKICVWHMNQEDMQVSYKGDSVGWGAYGYSRARDVIAAAKDNGAELIIHSGDLVRFFFLYPLPIQKN